MSNSDVKILRDELAKIIADNKKKDSVIEELIRIVEEGKKTTAELIIKIDLLERRRMIYENPHAPPSHGSVPAQQKKTRSAKKTKSSEQIEDKAAGAPGRKPGHTGVSHHRRSKEAVHHRPSKCDRRGGTGLSDVRTAAKQVIGIPEMPKAAVVTYVSHQCVCSDCEAVTVPKSPGIKGTSLGPNLLAFLTSVWGKAVSVGNATTLLNDTFGTGLCKTAVTHALVAASGSQHYKMLPVSGKTVLRPSYGGRIYDPARICVSISDPELFYPTREDIHGLCNTGSGLTLLFLQYDPFYLGFIQLSHHPYSSTSYMPLQLDIT